MNTQQVQLLEHFRYVFSSFQTVLDRFGLLWIVSMWILSDGFRIVFWINSDSFRIILDHFRTVSGRFPTISDNSTPQKNSHFNWPGLGPEPGRPPSRPEPSGPSPGQVKFEVFIEKIETKTNERNENERKKTKTKKVIESTSC